MLAYLLLAVAQVVGLLLIPFGGPGLWLQVASLALFGWWTEFTAVGAVPLGIILLVTLTAELAEAPLGGWRMRGARRRRSAFAGLAGGFVGAGIGTLFPLLGSVLGALAGTFTGVLLGALFSSGERTGCMPFFGQVVAVTMKTGAGVVVAVFTLLTLVR